MRLLGYGIAKFSGDGLGENGIERLGVLNCKIISMSSECVLDVGRGDRLIFSENIPIGIASGSVGDDYVRCNGAPFYLV